MKNLTCNAYEMRTVRCYDIHIYLFCLQMQSLKSFLVSKRNTKIPFIRDINDTKHTSVSQTEVKIYSSNFSFFIQKTNIDIKNLKIIRL